MQDDRPNIILDADFLSYFLKIDRVKLIKDFFNVECVSIPLAVFTEIGKTDLVETLIDADWIKIKTVKDLNYSVFNKRSLMHLVLVRRSA